MWIRHAEVVAVPVVLVAAVAALAWPRDEAPTRTLCVPEYHVAIAPAPQPALPPVVARPVIVEEQVFERSQLTAAMTFRGRFVRGVRWTDRAGDNIAVFSATDEALFVTQYASGRAVRAIQELDGPCSDDNGMRFHAADLVTDLDHDGVGELTFGYFHNACRTDMSPGDFKLFLLEGGDKYVLRGRAWMDELDAPSPVPAAPRGIPLVFLRHLERYWPWLANEMQSELPL
jgi:hypothetical protein